MSSAPDRQILVTGASGHFGRLVLERLLDLGVEPSRLVGATRRPESLADLAARGVEVRPSDFNDPASLDQAFAGAETLLIVSTDSLADGRRLSQHQAAAAAAGRAGVRHLLYTSMPAPETSRILFAPDHVGSEKAVRQSGASWTILRNQWYAENLLYAVPASLARGVWATAAGQGRIAYIPRAELALAAAKAILLGPSDEGKVLNLTGSAGWTVDEVAPLVAAAVGRPLAAAHVTLEEIVQGMTSAGFPEPAARVFASFDAASAAGDLSLVTDDFARLVGRPPQGLAEWIAGSAAVLAG